MGSVDEERTALVDDLGVLVASARAAGLSVGPEAGPVYDPERS